MTYSLHSHSNPSEVIKITKCCNTVPKDKRFETAKNYFMSVKNMKEDKFDKVFFVQKSK